MDTAGQLDVLGHDGDTLGVDVTQVCVFEEDLNLRSVLKSWTISWTRHWKGSLRMRSSVFFWQCQLVWGNYEYGAAFDKKRSRAS